MTRLALRRTLVGVACCIVLTACSDDQQAGPNGTGGSSDSTPPSGTTSRNSTAAPTSTAPTRPPPPEMPALASEKSPSGAKAFIEYWVATLNYSRASRTSSQFRKLATPTCKPCDSIADFRDDIVERGGKQVGGDWAAKKISPTSSAANLAKLIVKMHIEHGRTRKSTDSRFVSYDERTVYQEFTLAWQDGWLVEGLIQS